MHRADLEADLDVVYGMSRQRVAEGVMRIIDDAELDIMLETAPLPLQHAGMTYLHELAQDDVGLMRETERLNEALGNYEMRRSRELYPTKTPTAERVV